MRFRRCNVLHSDMKRASTGCALLGGDGALEFLEPVLEPVVSLAAAECRTLAS